MKIGDAMKKNGFTLIEITVCVLLLAIILVLVVPKVNTMISNSKKKSCDSIISTIEGSGKSYTYKHTYIVDTAISNDGYFEISLLDLQKEGLLDVDIENPFTNELIDNTNKLRITKEGNIYTYKYMGSECE